MEKGSLETKIEAANTWIDSFIAESVQMLLDSSDSASLVTETTGSTAIQNFDQFLDD